MTLAELSGKGWVLAEPPKVDDSENIVARYRGTEIGAGFKLDESLNRSEEYMKFRSGEYDVEVKFHFDVCRAELRVTEAEGYDEN